MIRFVACAKIHTRMAFSGETLHQKPTVRVKTPKSNFLNVKT